MSVISYQIGSTGEVGVNPRRCQFVVTDNYDTVITAGYLNNRALAPNQLIPTDIIDMIYSFSAATNSGTYGEFLVSITGGIITLVPVAGLQTSANNLTAHAGGGQTNALPLTADINNVTTVVTAGDSVKLPPAVGGNEIIVINDAVNSMQVFGSGSDTINDVAFATGVAQEGKSAVLYSSPAPGLWYSIGLGQTFVGGGGGLSGLGIHSASVFSTGATATNVVTDPAISASDVVIARFVSSANVVTTQTVLPGAGQFTLVTDTAPSTCVIEYISFLPSSSLISAGIVGGKGSYGGGSATFVISDPNITSGMVVNANFQSQVTPSRIYTVIAGAGTLTFVCSANPGVCVMEYMAVAPSSLLTSEGLEAVNYSYAGGYASIAITDPNITSASIVTADFQSQSVVALIQKVTPSNGSLTILASIDPGPSVVSYIASSPSASGSTSLLATNNLSDLTNVPTAVMNLGLGTLQQATVTLTPTQMAAAYATPIQLIANPLSSQMIRIIAADVYTASTGHTAYATGTAPIIQYSSGSTNGAHGTGTLATGAGLVAGDITAAASQVRNLPALASGAQTALSGLGIYFSNATGAYTAGTGTNVTFTITYETLTATV